MFLKIQFNFKSYNICAKMLIVYFICLQVIKYWLNCLYGVCKLRRENCYLEWY